MNLQALQTLLNHPSTALTELDDSNFSLLPPLYESVKYSFKNFGDFSQLFKGEKNGFVYGRVDHPNSHLLNQVLSQVTQKEKSLVFSSGMGAIASSLWGLTSPGDHVVAFYEGYSPTRQFIQNELSQKKVESHFLYIDQACELEQLFKQYAPRLIIFESPTNPQLRTLDLLHLTELAKKYQVLTLLDNTFNGFHNIDARDIDIVIHSLTKYATGHGDILGGSVSGSEEHLKTIHQAQIWMGNILTPYHAHRTLQYLKTYPLRYRQALKNAMELAPWLEKQAKVKNVIYPDIGKTLREDKGCVISFEYQGKLEDFFNRLKLIKVSASLGSTETLVAPCQLFYGHGLSPDQRTRMGLTEGLVRLSLGIENVEDVQKDLHNALS